MCYVDKIYVDDTAVVVLLLEILIVLHYLYNYLDNGS